ncbi:MAG: winged helix-turn-helix domain-containing protein, partial [Myxococcota bacterium]
MRTPIHLLRGQIDRHTGRGTVAGRPVHLTDRQLRLLCTLVDADGAVDSRVALEQTLGTNARAVDLVVLRLRRRVEVDPGSPAHILSVFGEGYRFVPAPPGGVEHPGLPPERAELFGRAAERSEVERALVRSGRVTLVGPGGVGTTALGLSVARV